jgi:hypothetical protein
MTSDEALGALMPVPVTSNDDVVVCEPLKATSAYSAAVATPPMHTLALLIPADMPPAPSVVAAEQFVDVTEVVVVVVEVLVPVMPFVRDSEQAATKAADSMSARVRRDECDMKAAVEVNSAGTSALRIDTRSAARPAAGISAIYP